MDQDALPKSSRRDLLIAGAAVLAASVLFATVLYRPAELTDPAVQASGSMNPFVAVALAVSAVGLIGLALGRWVVVAAAGWLVVLLGTVALLRSTFAVDLGVGALLGGRPGYAGALAFVPTTSTVCLLLIGAAELLGARARRWRERSAWLGLLGMSVVALAVFGGLTDLLGLGPPYTLGRGAPMSPVTALALAVVGAAATLTAWRASGGSPGGRAPAWLPGVAGLGAACGTLVLWWAAAGQEHADVTRRVEVASRTMASDLRSHFALLAAPLGGLTRREEAGSGAGWRTWHADAERLVKRTGSPYAAIGWVPAPRGAVPLDASGDSSAVRAVAARLGARAAWAPLPGGAGAGGAGALADPAPLVLRGDTDLALFVPAAAGAAAGAGVVAVLPMERMLDAVLGGGPSLEFDYRLQLDSAVFGAARRGPGAGATSLAQTVPVDPAAPRWRLTVWPIPAHVAAMTTPMDEIVLTAGLMVAALLALLARLWQQARARALEVETAHRNLAADVMRHERLEAQLRQAQKMEAVGQLTGGIAHDLNNVLTIVVANAELMAASLPVDAPELRSELGQLRAAASRGAAMVRQLLAFSRRKPLVPGPLDLVRVVDESTGLLRRLVPEHIVIAVAHEAPSLMVMGDAGAIEQALVNLVTNARDAMPGGGTLRLETRRATLTGDRAAAVGAPGPGEYGTFTIADTGVGMDAATRERAFEPFFTTKEPGAGTGLGLSMVYALVQQLGGSIQLVSGLGEGTSVTVHLPAAAAPAPAGAPARAPASAALTGDETILVVEDEAGIRRATRRVLERHGYRVLLAENGEQGLDAYRRHAGEIALVISDVVMPRMGGRDLYETLRGEGARVRFLFASGYASPQTEDTPSLAGVPHIAKPWTIEELLAKVRGVLDEGEDNGEVMT